MQLELIGTGKSIQIQIKAFIYAVDFSNVPPPPFTKHIMFEFEY